MHGTPPPDDVIYAGRDTTRDCGCEYTLHQDTDPRSLSQHSGDVAASIVVGAAAGKAEDEICSVWTEVRISVEESIKLQVLVHHAFSETTTDSERIVQGGV